MLGEKITKESRPNFKPEFRLEAAEAMNVGKSTVDKWVWQLNDEHNGIAKKPNALTPDQRKIKELEKKLRWTEEKKS